MPCCGNAGLTAKPLVADTACFDLLTFLDEDERGALGTAQDFESKFIGLIRIYIKSQIGFLQLGFFISTRFIASAEPGSIALLLSTGATIFGGMVIRFRKPS